MSLFVPAHRRLDWRAEWEAELWQLCMRTARSPGRDRSRNLAAVRYLAGAPLSALWEIKEEWMTDVWQDVRYAVRTLARSPGFLGVAVLTLAVGIGANTTMFSLVNGLLFRDPSGIAAPDRLVRLGRGHAPRFDNWSYPVFRDFRERAPWFAGVAAFADVGSLIVGRGLDAEAVPTQLVTAAYFDVLGVPLALGRPFVPEDVVPGVAPVAIISHQLWRRRFGMDSSAVGALLTVNGSELVVVGVAPPDFAGSDVFGAPPDLWLPVTGRGLAFGPGSGDWMERRGASWLWIFARLAPGVSFDQARSATEALYANFDEENPDLAGQGIWVSRGIGLTPDIRAEVTGLGRLLIGVVLLVLLIACANLAGLGLARGAGRRNEMGVRAALGASRIRVVRQLLTESLLLAMLGAVAAVGLTLIAAPRLHAVVPYELAVGLHPDVRVLALGLALAIAATLLFGLLPALRTARADVRGALAGQRTATAHGTGLRSALVALQLALSFVLLTGTGILLRSLHNARVVDPGFAPDAVAVLDLDAGMRAGYDEAAAHAFYDRLRQEAAVLPGIRAVGLVAELPIADFQSNHTPVVPGSGPDADPPPEPVLGNYADAGYFRAIGLELLAGRTFQSADSREGAERVAVINRTLAERFFGGADPVGRMLPFGAEPDWEAQTRVIGVVAEHRNRSLRAPPAAGYWIPFDRNFRGDMTLVARTEGEPAAAATRLARLVERIDPGMPVLRAAALRDLIGGTLRETRLLSTLIAIFGGIALGLATLGLYGVMAYSVAQRTRELGIRIALGATARNVLTLVLRQGLAVALAGLAVGALIAAGGLRLLQGMLFGVSPVDPATFGAGAALLVAVAIGAALLPARRATRVEPVRTLREE